MINLITYITLALSMLAQPNDTLAAKSSDSLLQDNRKALSTLEIIAKEQKCQDEGGAKSWIRVNQLGYLPNDVKVAVYISAEDESASSAPADTFRVFRALDGKVLFSGKAQQKDASKWALKSAFRLDFSPLREEEYCYIEFAGARSPLFRIGSNVYEGLSDYLLTYMRQQRCGYNPFNNTKCHTHDGYIVDHPTRSGQKIDVTGGWHDATDYLQYQTTTATTIYQMLFAYMEQPDKSIFKDEYNAAGNRGSNGIPDILDEARWGLEWLLKMNPQNKVMFSQIADDRDHAGFRLPYKDSVDYGWGRGEGRPVYFVTGKPQRVYKALNRTTGVSSVAGKFSSTFALGAEVFREIEPRLSKKMLVKASQAYAYAEELPGNTQTISIVSPYFYEEDTYTDDIELAASTLYHYTKDPIWGKRADYWGELEPVTPWMELGRGRHYQYYPFINLGHYYLASSEDKAIANKYREYMRMGLESIRRRAAEDPFMNGIPYIWCSNNLTSAAITQARLYNKVSGDSTYMEMEAALRDWLFGCNPWGTSMITGIPYYGDYPVAPHSSYYVINRDLTYGGLIDGPVYRSVFVERAGNSLTKEDRYACFNNGIAVYHDDMGDYATNEPTMDGTAGLTYYFAAKECEGLLYREANKAPFEGEEDNYGVIRRINPSEKSIYLLFTADSNFVGAESILKTLEKEKVKGSFFLTGNCLRMPENMAAVTAIVEAGHYVGGHSDKHLLYAPWEGRDSSYYSPEEIIADISANFAELEKFGVERDSARFFIPPYEHYNRLSVEAMRRAGLIPVNYTAGTATPADYTTPSMSNYIGSQELIARLYAFEAEKGLNGAMILIHPGVSEERKDRLYDKLGEIIKYLKKLGYEFKSLNQICTK